MTSHIQAVLFDKDRFDSKSARKWLSKNNLTAMKRVHKTDKYLRYRINDPKRYKRMRTKGIDNGVKFILGF